MTSLEDAECSKMTETNHEILAIIKPCCLPFAAKIFAIEMSFNLFKEKKDDLKYFIDQNIVFISMSSFITIWSKL